MQKDILETVNTAVNAWAKRRRIAQSLKKTV